MQTRTVQTGTYDERDEQPVAFEEAVSMWALAARDVLVETAGEYHAVVRYPELGERVQVASGVRTTKSVFQWVDEVLLRVSAECAARDEPLLSSLCVRADGSMGPGYARAVTASSGRRPSDPDQHAADERLRCYQAFGAELPAGGGVAARPTSALRQAPVRAASTRVPGSPRASAGAASRDGASSAGTATSRSTAARAAKGPSSAPTRKTTATRPAAPEPPAPAVCPTCFTQLPATGVCDNCA